MPKKVDAPGHPEFDFVRELSNDTVQEQNPWAVAGKNWDMPEVLKIDQLKTGNLAEEQIAAVDICLDTTGVTVIQSGTGTGKSLMQAFAATSFAKRTGKVSLYPAPLVGLVDQHTESARRFLSEGAQFIPLSNKHKKEFAEFLKTGVQGKATSIIAAPESLCTKLKNQDLNPKEVGCLILDEAHHFTDNKHYRELIKTCVANKIPVIMFSATPLATSDSVKGLLDLIKKDPSIEIKAHQVNLQQTPPEVKKVDIGRYSHRNWTNLMRGRLYGLTDNAVQQIAERAKVIIDRDDFSGILYKYIKDGNHNNYNKSLTAIFEQVKNKDANFAFGTLPLAYKLPSLIGKIRAVATNFTRYGTFSAADQLAGLCVCASSEPPQAKIEWKHALTGKKQQFELVAQGKNETSASKRNHQRNTYVFSAWIKDLFDPQAKEANFLYQAISCLELGCFPEEIASASRNSEEERVLTEFFNDIRNGERSFEEFGQALADFQEASFDVRAQLVIESLRDNPEGKKAVYLNNINEAQILAQKIAADERLQDKIKLQPFVFVYAGDASEQVLEDFSNHPGGILIGTKKMGEGKDFPRLSDQYILTVPDEPRDLVQLIGRINRNEDAGGKVHVVLNKQQHDSFNSLELGVDNVKHSFLLFQALTQADLSVEQCHNYIDLYDQAKGKLDLVDRLISFQDNPQPEDLIDQLGADKEFSGKNFNQVKNLLKEIESTVVYELFERIYPLPLDILQRYIKHNELDHKDLFDDLFLTTQS